MEHVEVSIQRIEFKRTGLLVAFSDTPGFEGLYVAARTENELNEWIDIGIQQLLEAQK